MPWPTRSPRAVCPFVFATGYGCRDIRVEDRDRPVLKMPFQYEKLVEILGRPAPSG
jgi:hypothetical protein